MVLGNVLIVGGSGMLGSFLMERISARAVIGTHYRTSVPDTVRLDLADTRSVRRVVRKACPEIVFFCGGLTRPDACEQEPERAREVNVGGVRRVLEAAPAAKLIYFSSDYVFDGRTGGYDEVAPPSPVNVYGLSKLEAEREVLNQRPSSLVVRVAGLYGWSTHNRSFIEPFFKPTLNLSTDHYSSCCFLDDIARAVPTLVTMSGVVHMVGPEVLSRAEFGQRVVHALNLDCVVRPTPGRAAYPGAPRPANSSLRTSRLRFKMTRLANALEELAQRLPELDGVRGGSMD